MKAILTEYISLRQEIHAFNAKTNNTISIYQKDKEVGFLSSGGSMEFSFDLLRDLLSGLDWELDSHTASTIAKALVRRNHPEAIFDSVENKSNMINELRLFFTIPNAPIFQGIGKKHEVIVSINPPENKIVLLEKTGITIGEITDILTV